MTRSARGARPAGLEVHPAELARRIGTKQYEFEDARRTFRWACCRRSQRKASKAPVGREPRALTCETQARGREGRVGSGTAAFATPARCTGQYDVHGAPEPWTVWEGEKAEETDEQDQHRNRHRHID